MFKPMALTVIFALVAAFILSLTVIPALVAILMRGRISEKENFLIRGVKRLYEPTLRVAIRARLIAAIAPTWAAKRTPRVIWLHDVTLTTPAPSCVAETYHLCF